ncbi:MAG: GTPase ObgE [Syntrophomonadaceae bacterium]|nr:GTPase ObgE [Syntrophomonadaceae bacterium]
MFVDRAKIYVKGGDGGNGIIAFRREKYVPMGGPAGGDGGRGGHVIFIADDNLATLMDFKYHRHFKAERGVHGQGKNMHGAAGEDMLVKVPVGTIIRDDDTGELIGDLVEVGQQAIVARGGRGGRGNARFSNSVNRAPSVSENGEPGEERYIRLELKLLADVGLVGFPNAGKSTFISRVSAARPKVADYPFTTLVPNLGVVQTKSRDAFVIADIPGLIAGAHEGTGLGHEFLRHIERTRLLIFVLDTAQTEGRDVIEDYETLRGELEHYRADLLERPWLVAANKMDLPEAAENLEHLQELFGDKVYPISAATGDGIEPLMDKAWELLQSLPREAVVISEEPVLRRFEEEEAFMINVVDGVYEVSGKRIEKLMAMTNFTTDEGLKRFQRTLEHMGLESQLRKMGIKEGDTVRISSMEFDYSE